MTTVARATSFVVWLPLYALATLSLGAQQPLNLGFEMESAVGPARPWGWELWTAASGTDMALDSTVRHAGRVALRISWVAAGDSAAEVAGPHALRRRIPAAFARGKRVRVSGWIRTADLRGGARISLEAWSGAEVSAADSTSPRAALGAGGTTAWTRYALEVPVDTGAHTVAITVSSSGAGTAWFDDLSLDVGGKSYDAVPTGRNATPAEIEWLARHAAPLRTVDATRPGEAPDFSDLGPVGRIAGDAHVITLGEATHGTSEFFRMKHRLLEYFVREKGASVFAIEANQLAVEQVNAYVRGGSGTVQSVMKVMFRVWNTEEVRPLVEWMRTYNATRPARPIEFVGFDMQDPSLPIDSLHAFLSRTDRALAGAADSLYDDYRKAWRKSQYPQAPDSVREGWLGNALEMWRRVGTRRGEWLTRAATPGDSAAVEWALQNANVVRQAARLAMSSRPQDRDSTMAANLDWALARRGPGTRAVVWAHDVHLSRSGGFANGTSMGVYLSRSHGDDMRTFGIETYDGAYTGTVSFTDHRIVPVRAYPAPAGSVEESLHRVSRRLGAPRLVVDLRPARTDEGGRWLREPRPIRSIGYSAFDFGFEQSVVVPEEFDALLFIDRTTGSRLLR